MTCLTVTIYLCYKWSRICSIYRSYNPAFPHSWFISGFVTSVTWRLALVEQELYSFSEHLSSTSVFSGIRVAESLVFSVVFYRPLFVCLSVFVWPLYRLSFFDLRLLTTTLVSTSFNVLLMSSLSRTIEAITTSTHWLDVLLKCSIYK